MRYFHLLQTLVAYVLGIPAASQCEEKPETGLLCWAKAVNLNPKAFCCKWVSPVYPHILHAIYFTGSFRGGVHEVLVPLSWTKYTG